MLDGKEFVPPDDEEFTAICRELSDPHSPYNFDQIPISILGSIYERFLGKVVHATDKRVKVEEKPEVRKAGGVYYTPEYIVRYIVNETVGKLLYGDTEKRSPLLIREDQGEVSKAKTTLEPPMVPLKGGQLDHLDRIDGFGRTPEEIAKMAFADIACGSGSFLIEVYTVLLDYHIRYYLEHPEKQKETDVFERDGKLHLTLKKKKEILQNNIYGVDIDFQATEVTQLSLYLKLLEDVTMHDAHQFGMFKETILPDLRKNIVNGNSLIGRDIIDGQLFANVDENKLKPMNFEDAFPAVMKRGGFDAVVGNPPYRMIQPHNTEPEIIEYMRTHFVAADFKVDLFHLFLQRAASVLRKNAYLGYIVPATLLNNVYVEALRKWLMNFCEIRSIAVAPGKVFKNADVHTCVIIFRKQPDANIRSRNKILTTYELTEEFSINPLFKSVTIQNDFLTLPGSVWNILVNETNSLLIKKLLADNRQLKDIADINRGLITGDREKYFSKQKKTKRHIPIITGSDVHRYTIVPPAEFVLFERPDTAGGCWDEKVHLAQHKIVVRQIGTSPTASILRSPIAVTGNIFTIMSQSLDQELYMLGIINSRITEFFWNIMFSDFKTSFPQVTIFSLSQLPIRSINFEDVQDKSRRDAIVKLVEQMLDAKEKLSNAKTEAETNRCESLCQTLDRQIDEQVYELYGLTPEEITIVEGKV